MSEFLKPIHRAASTGHATGPNPEIPKNNFIELLSAVNRSENPQPLTVEEVGRAKPDLIAYLKAAGINFEVINTKRYKTGLREEQFRRLTTGAGPALAAALDGPEASAALQVVVPPSPNYANEVFDFFMAKTPKVMAVRSVAQDLSAGQPMLSNEHTVDRSSEEKEYTQRRGLEVLLARTIALAVDAITIEDYVNFVNWRRAAKEEKKLAKIATAASKHKDEPGSTYSDDVNVLNEFRQRWGIPSRKAATDADRLKRDTYENEIGKATIPLDTSTTFFNYLSLIGQSRNRQDIENRFPRIYTKYSPATMLGNDAKPPADMSREE